MPAIEIPTYIKTFITDKINEILNKDLFNITIETLGKRNVDDILLSDYKFTFTEILSSSTPLVNFFTIDSSGGSFNVPNNQQAYVIVDDLAPSFTLEFNGVDGATFDNNFNENDFNDCYLDITNTSLVSSNKDRVYVTENVSFSTVNNEFFTFYYFNTGSLILGFSPASATLEEPLDIPSLSSLPSLSSMSFSLSGEPEPEVTPTPTVTPTPSLSEVTPTPTPTVTPTPSLSEVTPTPTPTPTVTPAPIELSPNVVNLPLFGTLIEGSPESFYYAISSNTISPEYSGIRGEWSEKLFPESFVSLTNNFWYTETSIASLSSYFIPSNYSVSNPSFISPIWISNEGDGTWLFLRFTDDFTIQWVYQTIPGWSFNLSLSGYPFTPNFKVQSQNLNLRFLYEDLFGGDFSTWYNSLTGDSILKQQTLLATLSPSPFKGTLGSNNYGYPNQWFAKDYTDFTWTVSNTPSSHLVDLQNWANTLEFFPA